MTENSDTGLCSICGDRVDDFFAGYPNPVCRQCDSRAVNESGAAPEHQSMFDSGDNPVFIDGKKCWRRYRYGGFVTMFDDLDCDNLREFHDRRVEPHWDRKSGGA